MIGRASSRPDGFVSLDAGAFEGWVRTVPLAPARRRLEVNADAAAGSLAVAVLAEDGTPLDGYSAADCMPLRANRMRHGVRWSGCDRLPGGRPVRLQFNLRDTDLYSFRLRA